MAHSKEYDEHHCCSDEKKELDQALFKCDYCSTSYEEHSACYQQEAKASGLRGRACVIRTRSGYYDH